MRSSIAPILYWSYWANVIYILGMFGYLTIDTVTYIFPTFDSTLSSSVYIFLAILFVIDATLYTIDWYMYAVKLRANDNAPIEYRAEFVACIFQHLGSYCYLIGALLLFSKTRLLRAILLSNFIGILAFLTESLLTFLGWRIALRKRPPANAKRGCVPQDVYMWAHLFNIIAAILYLCATTLAYRLYVNYKIVNATSVLILQMIGDLTYLFDAYLYYDCWQQDKQEYDANTERQRLIELNLVKQLTTEHLDNGAKMDEKKIDLR